MRVTRRRRMAEVEEKQLINQEKEEQQEKEEVMANESEQPTEQVTSEATTTEEETQDPPAVEETAVEEETTGEEETTEEEKPKLKIEDIKTAPADFRFPTTNQSRHCFTRYIEYHKCVAAKGEDANECEKFKRYYRSLCPDEWIERWNEQRENGTFPGPL